MMKIIERSYLCQEIIHMNFNTSSSKTEQSLRLAPKHAIKERLSYDDITKNNLILSKSIVGLDRNSDHHCGVFCNGIMRRNFKEIGLQREGLQ